MLIVRFRSDLLRKVRTIFTEWASVQNERGEVTFLLRYIIVDFLNLVGLNDLGDYQFIFGQEEGGELWQRENG